MKTGYMGFNENVLTFEADDALTEAFVPIKLTAEGKAAPCAEGEAFCGVAVNVRGGYAGVQLSGFVKMPAAAAVKPGYCKLACGADGAVAENKTSGREYLVLEANGDEIGFIL